MNKVLRDMEGKPVFVKNDGSYCYEFPKERIVRKDEKMGGYVVYFFIPYHAKGRHYKEFSCEFKLQENAIDFATEIHGKEFNFSENISGEAFDIEIHEK